MANEDELEQLSADMQAQQAKGEAIRRQIEAIQGSLVEIGGAIEVIQNLKKAKGDTLVPAGAGVFLSFSKPDPDKIMLNLGAGIMVGKKPEEAVKLLEERQKKLAESMTMAQSELSKIVAAIESLTARASEIGAAEERNVRPSQG